MFTVQLFNRDVVYRPFAFAIVLAFGLSLASATPTYLRPDSAVASNISRSPVFCHTRSKFFRSLGALLLRASGLSGLTKKLRQRAHLHFHKRCSKKGLGVPAVASSSREATKYDAFAERNVPQLWWPPTVS